MNLHIVKLTSSLDSYMQLNDERIDREIIRTNRLNTEIYGEGAKDPGIKNMVHEMQWKEERRAEKELEQKDKDKNNRNLILTTLATALLGIVAWIWNVASEFIHSIKNPPTH